MDCALDSYDYVLPPEAIAQVPVWPRDHSRLLVGITGKVAHRHFYDLPELLEPGDLLVLNDTQVIPARLRGQRRGGGQTEILLLRELATNTWQCLVRPGRRLPPGSRIYFPDGTQAQVLSREEEGTRQVLFQLAEPFYPWLWRTGEVPLPPYITTPAQPADYQTLWAKEPGAVAAPTAGLHFTEQLLAKLTQRGISTAQITLHVGLGTFRPVESSDIRQHQMHPEWIVVPETTVAQIQRTQAAGGRVIAVGTTVARALESASQSGDLAPYAGWANIFIYPGYSWHTVQGLITNFHLPKSTLMMMVSSLIGRERLLALYQVAIAEGYRFYSFGDAMFLVDEKFYKT